MTEFGLKLRRSHVRFPGFWQGSEGGDELLNEEILYTPREAGVVF